MHHKKRIMKDSSSLIIVKKKFIQLGPRAYHQVLVMPGSVQATPQKIENAASTFGLPSTLIHQKYGA